MLKFFYRLKRRGGVVLFAVIAIMTLLIAMATTAYFTARSSYKTVISNYNFSQMYLAATSISDMMIGAATQSAQYSDETKGAVDKNNYFKALRDAIQDLKKKKAGDPAAQFTVLSENISSLYSGGTISDAAVFKALETANSTEPGVLDAVKVVVSLDRIAWESDSPQYSGNHDSPAATGLSKYYYTFTTTAYYRGNSITVQDTVYNLAGTLAKKKSTTPDFSTFFTSTGQNLTVDGEKEKGDRAVIIDCDTISDKSYFQSRVTIFSSSTRNNWFQGGVTTSGALYLCGQVRTELSGTKIAAPGNNAKGEYDRHDWFVGGDMFVINTNTRLDLNGNNLYVKGDLVLSSQQGIHAANIFVEGNVYILNDQAQLETTDGGLYVKGNIIGGGKPQNLTLSNAWSKRDTTQVTVGDSISYIINRINDAKARSGGSFSYDGNATAPSNPWGADAFYDNKFSGNIYMNGTISGWNNNAPSKTGAYKAGTVSVDIVTQQQNFKTYTTVPTTIPIETLFDTTSGNSPMRETNFANLTSTAATLENTLNLDFTNFGDVAWPKVKNSSGQEVVVAGTEATFTNKSGETVTVKTLEEKDSANVGQAKMEFTFKSKDNRSITVTKESGGSGSASVTFDIPWNANGYNLYLQGQNGDGSGFPFGDSNNVTYRIGTKASTFSEEEVTGEDGTKTKKIKADPDNAMPIMLRANFETTEGESKTKDKNGFNGFSWKGSNYNSEGATSRVVLVDDSDFSKSAVGEVVFEMGNISAGWTDTKEGKTFAAGDYMYYRAPYKPETGAAVKPVASTVTYFMSQKNFVGTLEQWNGTKDEPWENKDKFLTFYSKGSDPDPKYDNRVMLVSNENGATAINDYRKGNVFCGYIYAPNGSLYSYGDGKIPIFGGLIVSDYAAINAYYYYCEPDPRYVYALSNALEDPDAKTPDGEEKTPDDGYWYTYGVELGRNYLG